MRKLLYKLLCLIMLCFFTTDITGCGSETSSEGIALVIIVGKHANANNIAAQQKSELNNMIRQSFSYWKEDGKFCAEAEVSIIVCDGNSTKATISVDGEQLSLLCNTSNNKNNRKNIVKNIQEGIIDYISSDELKADDEEVDLMGALTQARIILNNSTRTEKYIMILDTGITTAGLFNMNTIKLDDMDSNGNYETAENMVSCISEEAFPELGDIKVVFYGLGNVGGMQSFPHNNNVLDSKLAKVWTLILDEKCHAELQNLDNDGLIKLSENAGDALLYNEDGSGYPYVTPIEFKIINIDSGQASREEDSEETSKKNTGENLKPLELAASWMGFLPQQSFFRDEEKTIERLREKVGEYREYLDSDSNNILYIVGSIAKTSPTDSLPSHWLSAERAQKVIDILVMEHGFPKEQLVLIDAGTTVFSWRNADEFPDGNENDDNQEANRKVEIIPDCCTEEVQELRDAGYIE